MAWTGVGAALAGTAASSAFGHFQAGRQMDFQRRMSSTAYQRSMRDMRKAGLNPILAYQQGGASTPGGAAASAPDAGANITQAHTAKLQRDNLREQNKNLEEQNKNLQETRDQIREQTAKLEAEAERIRQQTRRDDVIGNIFESGQDLGSWIPGMGSRNPGWDERLRERLPDFLKKGWPQLIYEQFERRQRSSESSAKQRKDDDDSGWLGRQFQRFIDWANDRDEKRRQRWKSR